MKPLYFIEEKNKLRQTQNIVEYILFLVCDRVNLSQDYSRTIVIYSEAAT